MSTHDLAVAYPGVNGRGHHRPETESIVPDDAEAPPVHAEAIVSTTREKITEVSSFRWQNGAVYAIVSAAIALLTLILSNNADRKQENHDLAVRMEAQEKVNDARRALDDYKAAAMAEKVTALTQKTQLYEVQIANLKEAVAKGR